MHVERLSRSLIIASIRRSRTGLQALDSRLQSALVGVRWLGKGCQGRPDLRERQSDRLRRANKGNAAQDIAREHPSAAAAAAGFDESLCLVKAQGARGDPGPPRHSTDRHGWNDHGLDIKFTLPCKMRA